MKKFKGELHYIEPYRIINKTRISLTDNFFLTLALIYNDLKDLMLFQIMLQNQYENPADDKPTAHAGEFGGIRIHIIKLLISHMHEFFNFLEKNNEVLISREFNQVLEKTNKTIEAEWTAIVNVAKGQQPEDTIFAKNLIKIRNNVSYHYYHSGKALSESFKNYFFKRGKIDKNTYAYYNLGDMMEETRFCYADAAVEEYIRGTVTTKSLSEAPSAVEIAGLTLDTIKKMNVTINRIMRAYLKNRPK